MTYHDDILTITLCRGDIATSLGERGLKVTNWTKLVAALTAELSRETASQSDGHAGISAVGDLLLDRIIDEGHGGELAGLKPKSDGSERAECWPFEEPWWNS